MTSSATPANNNTLERHLDRWEGDSNNTARSPLPAVREHLDNIRHEVKCEENTRILDKESIGFRRKVEDADKALVIRAQA